MPAKPKSDVRFSITFEESHEYLHCHVEAWVMTDDGLRRALYRFDEGWNIADLVVRGQVDRLSTHLYGYRASFRPYDVDLDRAEMMVKTLRLIERNMAKLQERLGYPTDMAGFLSHLALALDTTETRCFGRRVPKGSAQDMNGTGYRWMDTDDLRRHITDEIEKWRTAYGVTPRAEAS